MPTQRLEQPKSLRRPLRYKGFTLIELLIVVAIIAILAAIAVPNFLEAQTRSKVSRVMADMRSLKTAIEAYAVDNNKYPPPVNAAGQPLRYEQRYKYLSTPVAYMSSIPRDTFGIKFPPGSGVWPQVDPVNPEGYFDYWTLDAAKGTNPNNTQPWNFPWNADNFKYQLRSIGPDRLYEGTNTYPAGHPWAGTVTRYDPTNGTVSRGDILMWGPG